MKKIMSFFFAGLVALSTVASYTAFAKGLKTAVCHITGNGTYQLIVISDNAVGSHLNHGDILMNSVGLCDPEPPEDPPPPPPPLID